MNDQHVASYLLAKPCTSLDYPFGPDVRVFRLDGKMFALLSLVPLKYSQSDGPRHWWLNLKCEPHEALLLRELFAAVLPAYHMNKAHWNSVILDASVPDGELRRMMDNSYQLVLASLPKKRQAAINLHL